MTALGARPRSCIRDSRPSPCCRAAAAHESARVAGAGLRKLGPGRRTSTQEHAAIWELKDHMSESDSPHEGASVEAVSGWSSERGGFSRRRAISGNRVCEVKTGSLHLSHDNCAEPDCSTIGSLCERCFALFETSHEVGLVLAEVEHIRIGIATPHKTRYGQYRKYLKFWNAIAFASRIFADMRETFFSLFFSLPRKQKKKKFR